MAGCTLSSAGLVQRAMTGVGRGGSGNQNTTKISQALRISRLEFARSESSAANLFGTSHLAVSGVVFSPPTPPRAHRRGWDFGGAPAAIRRTLSYVLGSFFTAPFFFFLLLLSCQFLAAVARHRRTGRALVHIKALLV